MILFQDVITGSFQKHLGGQDLDSICYTTHSNNLDHITYSNNLGHIRRPNNSRLVFVAHAPTLFETRLKIMQDHDNQLCRFMINIHGGNWDL